MSYRISAIHFTSRRYIQWIGNIKLSTFALLKVSYLSQILKARLEIVSNNEATMLRLYRQFLPRVMPGTLEAAEGLTDTSYPA